MAGKNDDELKDIKNFFQSVPGLITLGIAAVAVLTGFVWSIVTGIL